MYPGNVNSPETEQENIMTVTISRRTATLAAAAILAVIALAVLAGCGIGKATEPFRDAAVIAQLGNPAYEVTMPDGFNNLSLKCVVINGAGFLVGSTYHGDRAYGGVVITPAPACKNAPSGSR